MFSVGSKSLNSRGFWKMAKNKKALREAIRLPSHFVHHDLMPRKGQRQQQRQKSSFIIHHPFIHPSSIVPSSFQFRKSQHFSAFAIFSAFALNSGGWKCFSYLRSPKAPAMWHPKLPKKDKSISCQIMENLHSYGVFQSCQKGISKINITRTSNVLFDTSGCRKRSGCFFWGDEWRAQHVMRCGKIVSKKSPPQGWLPMERHNFWRPHPRVGHSFEA